MTSQTDWCNACQTPQYRFLRINSNCSFTNSSSSSHEQLSITSCVARSPPGSPLGYRSATEANPVRDHRGEAGRGPSGSSSCRSSACWDGLRILRLRTTSENHVAGGQTSPPNTRTYLIFTTSFQNERLGDVLEALANCPPKRMPGNHYHTGRGV